MKMIQNIWTSLKPYGPIRRRLERWSFHLFEAPRLLAFHNLYVGQRCLIVGNGPSLKQLELSKLKTESTFVTNMFALIGPEVGFEPTFYCMSDWIHWSKGFSNNLLAGIDRYQNTKYFLEYDAKRIVRNNPIFSRNELYYLGPVLISSSNLNPNESTG